MQHPVGDAGFVLTNPALKGRMSRTLHEVPQPLPPDDRPRNLASIPKSADASRQWNVWLFRIALIAISCAVAVGLSPLGLHGWAAAGLGLALAIAIVAVEHRLRSSSATALLGGVVGGLFGALAALLVSILIFGTSATDATKSFLAYSVLLAFGYVGVMIGSQKAIFFKPESLQGILRPRVAPSSPCEEGKLLDTSVLIDGRIAEICEAHFLDGPLLVPQFVLHELQMIADSSESLRRQRGRRGLEVLQRIQKMQTLEVRIIDDNPQSSNEVDRKLIDLALRFRARIVTNDFNLNKVASVQGISVLNVNLLANAVRPAFLPGEGMRVFILREGKEVNQGVAYLEDGTMVVVDGGRRLINKTVDILVTSVHQTPAGKMIFGRLDDHTSDTPIPPGKQASPAARPSRPGFPESAG
jgi:uncharacterized protein YacL